MNYEDLYLHLLITKIKYLFFLYTFLIVTLISYVCIRKKYSFPIRQLEISMNIIVCFVLKVCYSVHEQFLSVTSPATKTVFHTISRQSMQNNAIMSNYPCLECYSVFVILYSYS